MKQLIKLHIGLTKYLIKEIPKQKTLKDILKFLILISGIYIKELIKLYKNLFLVFDEEYQKQKKEFNKRQKIRIDLQRCVKMLQYIDEKMVKQGKNRQEIRQFWLDFTKDGQVRQDVFDELMKEIERIR